MEMRIVVTGASGNLGTPLLDQLSGHVVVAIARRPPETETRPYVSWRAIDISTPEAGGTLAGAFAGTDVVVHLAWLIQPSVAPDLLRATNVDGTGAVLRAVAAAKVPSLVYASSVGAYSKGPKQPPVAESWPTGGIQGSMYSQQKAQVERMLDTFETDHPDVRVVRIRPGVILAGRSSSEQARYFLGPFLPMSLLQRRRLPIAPALPGLAVQVVHADDAAAAFATAALGEARGAFNIATAPVVTNELVREVIGARSIPVPWAVATALAAITWKLRLQPTDPGWPRMGRDTPVMATDRARTVLGWTPLRNAGAVVAEALDGMADRRGSGTPALRPASSYLDQVTGGIRTLGRRFGARV
jgi:nucleoside-diphosphate-sugar epimerase